MTVPEVQKQGSEAGHPLRGVKLEFSKLHFRLTLCWVLYQDKHVFKARNMWHREGEKFLRGIWLPFVCVSSHFVCLRNVHFYSLFSLAKSEHNDLKGWADGIRSAAESWLATYSGLWHEVIWDGGTVFSVFHYLQISSRHAFQNPWRKGPLQVQNTILMNWSCENLLPWVQPGVVTEQTESSL